jgi:hypothetical protein
MSWITSKTRTPSSIGRYIDILRALGKQSGTLGSIYAGAQSRFTKPVSLKTLINRIDETEWTALGARGVGAKASTNLDDHCVLISGCDRDLLTRWCDHRLPPVRPTVSRTHLPEYLEGQARLIT